MAALGAGLIGQRLRSWRDSAWTWLAPVPAAPSDTQLVKYGVRVLPTQAGVGFALLVVVLLVGARNDALWLGHLLAFVALACLLVDLAATWRNLAALKLVQLRPQPVFAGGSASIAIRVENLAQRDRYALHLAFTGQAGVSVDLPAGSEASVRLPLAARQRGWLRPPRITLSASFPLGLFRAWCHWQPASATLVYPCPEPALPAPVVRQQAAGDAGNPQQGEVAGIRAYQAGDSLRQMAWRQMARVDPRLGGPLLSKQLEDAPRASVVLDLAALPEALDLERKLARLAGWVLEAEQGAVPYALRLGTLQRPAGRGAPHCAACLGMLALYGLKDPA